MSADYILALAVNINDILGSPGIRLDNQDVPGTYVITDGTNYLHVHCNHEKIATECTRYGGNNEDAIFKLLQEADIGWHPTYIG